MGIKLLTASLIAPMDRAPIRDGAIAFSDKILDVGDARSLRARHPDAEPIDLGEHVVLPGLVNPHCHLELTLATRPAPLPFVPWVKQLIGQGFPDHPNAVRSGLDQCLKFGVTAVGDITAFPGEVRKHLRPVPRVVSFGEVRAMAGRRHLLDERVAAALDGSSDMGISPHAPYSIEIDRYRRCLREAKQGSLPITTHLAETADEAEFLATHSGPLREIWDFLGGWDNQVPSFIGGPIRFAHSIGLLDYEKSSLAHVNYCDVDELDLLAGGKASVIYCPRTHRYFNHPPHRWREMLARGINVAVGTDSCASSPDLDLVDDLRLLHEIAPEISPHTLWEMATLRAAKAIAMQDRVGSLTIRKQADFVVFDSMSGDPLRSILETDALPIQIWINGSRTQTRPTSP